ncbi:MAG TPA: hypothetical protein DIW23_06405 [Anaerolineae bacterium]|nr:hypothetical protein [Anaerolineae bacterium]
METNTTSQPASGTNRNLIIGIVIAIVLCCCCAITAVAGYYGYQTYLEAQRIAQDLQEFEIPQEFLTPIPGDPFDPNQPTPSFDLDVSGEIPSGGLADDETRLTAWFSVQLVAILSECPSPTVEGTTITVIQQPDANGEWQEEWDVNCGDGTSKPFILTFTPNENGTINVDVDVPGQ